MHKNLDFSHAKRGAVVPTPKDKTRLTLSIDTEILDWFREQVNKADGGNYQSLINEALKSFIETRKEPLETIVRRVVRQELKKAREPKRPRTKAA